MKNISFETELEKLEKVAGALEAGDLDLAQTLKKYEQGIKAYRACRKILAEAERRIEILSKDESGELAAMPFAPEGDKAGQQPRTAESDSNQ